jgi:asparagine synthase (glutamine-hydrolysing)
MRDTIAHRGPDDAGAYFNGHIGLGHRRLSIVDVAGGHQPMANEDRTVWIVFNGEIYNHPQLRPELESRGHIYRNNSDTETIVHLYEDRGPGVVEELSGMFAFAIWDEANERLLLARDRLGIKPLYYFLAEDGTLYFASEIKSLLASRRIVPEINFNVLPDYLANQAPTGEETMFAGVKRLPPGHTLVWQNGKVTIREYWDVSFVRGKGHEQLGDNEYVEQWREMFRRAVSSHLMSDVPLGVFLSGGIDSSAIAAMMSELVSEPIKTFSVAFAEREANELEYARIVAREFQTDHHEVIVSPEQYFAALPKLIWQEDEPIAHLASVPLYFVSELAVKHVKVVLTGEGSDELLAGYARYRKTVYNMAFGRRYQGWTPNAFQRLVRQGVEHSLPPHLVNKMKRTFLWRSADVENLYFDNFAVFPLAMQQQLLTPSARQRAGALDPYFNVRRLISESDAETLLNQLLYADLKTYLHELLMKQDQMSMAASLESRVPFLDWPLVEFTTRLPERLKLRGWTTKHILRQAMRGILPETILTRPKMGFPVPLGAWLRGRFRNVIDDCVTGERALARGIFNRDFLIRLVAEHQSGVKDHSQRLWALLNFELWMRQFIDGEKAEESLGLRFAAAAAI